MSAAQHPSAKPAPGPGDAVFDRWLRTELSRLYDSALSEPVPDDLLRLLDQPEAPQKPPGR